MRELAWGWTFCFISCQKCRTRRPTLTLKQIPLQLVHSFFFEKSFQLFFLPLTEVKAYMEGGQFTPPLDAQGILGGLLAAAPLKFSHSHLGFGFLCSVSSTNMFPSAFIFKKCVEVFHLQKTFLPSFFTATDVFL